MPPIITVEQRAEAPRAAAGRVEAPILYSLASLSRGGVTARTFRARIVESPSTLGDLVTAKGLLSSAQMHDAGETRQRRRT